MKVFLKKIVFVFTAIVSCTISAQTATIQNLNSKQQAIIKIATLTAKGNLLNLKTELNNGLNTGLTVSQVKEVMVHLYAYCGFPRSIRGIQTLMTVIEERKIKGIKDIEGTDASPIVENGSKYDKGKAVLEELTGASQDGPKTGYAAFAPVMDVFLKEHLFADIFERDVLTYTERELITISVLASIGGVEPMLESHLKICLNIGLTPNELQAFVEIIKSAIGSKEAKAAQEVLDKVLKATNKK